MGGRRGVPLRDRVRPGMGTAAGPSGHADDPATPARHCWVADPADHSPSKRPGLLVEWRPAVGGGWQGRVLYVAELRAGSSAVVEEWVDEALLTPA
jgi:hypothetical protein